MLAIIRFITALTCIFNIVRVKVVVLVLICIDAA